jgi:hypothetical protein
MRFHTLETYVAGLTFKLRLVLNTIRTLSVLLMVQAHLQLCHHSLVDTRVHGVWHAALHMQWG